MNIPTYDDTDLAADIVLKHKEILNAIIIEDITTAIGLAFGDGFCRGYNEANEWYSYMDEDDSYINSFDSVQPVDTFNDDLVGAANRDIVSLEQLLEYSKMMSEEERYKINKLTKDMKIDLNKPLDDEDE